MKTKSIIGLAVMGLMLISCQSNSYQINGFALHLQEGDTVLLAHDAEPERPFAMTTVNHGKFYFEGTTDDDAPCRIYMKRIPECAAFFFPDQGTIAVELCLPPPLQESLAHYLITIGNNLTILYNEWARN